MTSSRSRQTYMNSVSKPTSWAATPSQSRWLCSRSSSQTRVRRYRPRLGTSRPAIFSTAWTKAVVWEWEQMPQMRSSR